jgi:hypothetical protein
MQSTKELRTHENAYHSFTRMIVGAAATVLVVAGIVILLISH